ncbi:hypothetical protein ABG067_006412 [Albugo candida]|uniref:Dynein light chain n=2 Tax=Albugo candida TaxID=65357 RepID=A0A024GA95_9STRA|nr:unnamed protein product [Albugo candida]|eukprot:CCI43584.1 unnamed protein product [Albugo candida]
MRGKVSSKTVVYAEDMTEPMLEKVTALAKDAFQLQITAGKTFSSIADFIRRHMDKEYGRGWNCIVGNSFGAFVTHEIKTYVYFSVTFGVSILLWKT